MSKMWVREIAYFVNTFQNKPGLIHQRAHAAFYEGSLEPVSLSFYKPKWTSEQNKKGSLSLVHLMSKMWVRKIAYFVNTFQNKPVLIHQ